MPTDRRTAAPTKRRGPTLDRSCQWLLSALMLVAIALAAWGLGSVLEGRAWWFAMVAFAALVLGSAAVIRSLSSHPIWSIIGSAFVAVCALTLFFAPGTGFIGFIPSFDTVEAFRLLEAASAKSILSQDVPAKADTGIVFLLSASVAGIAWTMDVAAHLLRKPAIAGIPLLVLLLVPSFVRAEFADPWHFAIVAIAFLALLLVRERSTGRGAAIGISAAALVGALVVPLALPSVGVPTSGSGGLSTVATGVNPLISLGSDLRRSDPVLALTYRTTSTEPLYLRLTALDNFAGESWLPTNDKIIPDNDLREIGPPPGLGEGITTVAVTTDVTVASILSKWLPAPYAPTSVRGLEGQWNWEPSALAIRTDDDNAREQTYVVESVQIAPSVDQLMAADPQVAADMEKYLQVPNDLPDVVRETALEVVGDAANNYDRAMALQNHFTDGTYTYSEETPVEEGYDGTGASVLADFLEAQSGYCVHFSSAMAAMARTLGIPARIAVGFTPGERREIAGSDEVQYRVTTHNLHAWPELYFSGIGWVRFEPTPGRGDAPAFAPLAVDDPQTPDVDESRIPTPTPTTTAPTPAPTTTPTGDRPELNDPESQGGSSASTTGGVPWAAIVGAIFVLLLLVPWALRAAKRQRRLEAVARGSAVAGRDEVLDTADDLGLALDDGLTPRQAAVELAYDLSPRALEALGRVVDAVEAESFAESPGDPNPADVRAVLRALRRDAGLGHRLLATFLPRSLVRAWLPQARRYELH